MVICNYHWLNSTSRVLISTCSAPLVQTGERKQFSLFDLDLIYDLDLQSHSSQGQDRPSCQKSRSKVKRFKQESAHRQTDGRTHTHTDATKHIMAPAMWSIEIQNWFGKWLQCHKLPIGYNWALYSFPQTDPQNQLTASSQELSDLLCQTASISDQQFCHNTLDRHTDTPTNRQTYQQIIGGNVRWLHIRLW